MITKYKLIIGQGGIEFLTNEELIQYTIEHNIQNPVIEIIQEEIVEQIDYIERLNKDLEFGKYLIQLFLIDNRLIPQAVSTNDSLTLLMKFQNIEALARLGDIKGIQSLLPSISTDNLFTQERKDKYINLVNQHLLYL